MAANPAICKARNDDISETINDKNLYLVSTTMLSRPENQLVTTFFTLKQKFGNHQENCTYPSTKLNQIKVKSKKV
jgi:hypothetical protein